MYCPDCHNDNDFEIREEKEIICVREENIEIVSKITYCKKCGTKVWNSELDNDNLKTAYDLYRRKHNLLTSEEIKAIRNKYGISQALFAKVLGLDEKHIMRYENGSIQDIVHNDLILFSKNIDEFKKMFERKIYKFNDAEKEEINDILRKNIK